MTNTPEKQLKDPRWKSLAQAVHTLNKNPCDLRLSHLKWLGNDDWSRAAYHILSSLLRHRTLIHALIEKHVSRRPKPLLSAFLSMGIAQILTARDSVSDIPKIVHHSVELVRQHCSRGESGFVNATLRNLSATLSDQLGSWELEKNWSVLFSHPQWIIDRWEDQWGEESTRGLLEWNQQIPTHYIHRLRSAEVTTSPPSHPSPDVPCLPSEFRSLGTRKHTLIEDEIGDHSYVQDPATALAPAMFEKPLSGAVLDACAAPGGKTVHLSKALGAGATLHASDSDLQRLEVLRENLTRLGLEHVTAFACDWEQPNDSCIPQKNFQNAIVDVPCSSTGIIQKHPEIRWRLKQEEFATLALRQLTILRNVASRIDSGGQLVYSTCSIDKEENDGVVTRFLSTKEGQAFDLIRSRIFLPHLHRHDGAGAHLFIRRH